MLLAAIDAGDLRLVTIEGDHAMRGDDVDAHLQQSAMDQCLFRGMAAPARYLVSRRHQRHLEILGAQQLGDHACHVVVIVIVYQH